MMRDMICLAFGRCSGSGLMHACTSSSMLLGQSWGILFETHEESRANMSPNTPNELLSGVQSHDQCEHVECSIDEGSIAQSIRMPDMRSPWQI